MVVQGFSLRPGPRVRGNFESVSQRPGGGKDTFGKLEEVTRTSLCLLEKAIC